MLGTGSGVVGGMRRWVGSRGVGVIGCTISVRTGVSKVTDFLCISSPPEVSLPWSDGIKRFRGTSKLLLREWIDPGSKLPAEDRGWSMFLAA